MSLNSVILKFSQINSFQISLYISFPHNSFSFILTSLLLCLLHLFQQLHFAKLSKYYTLQFHPQLNNFLVGSVSQRFLYLYQKHHLQPNFSSSSCVRAPLIKPKSSPIGARQNLDRSRSVMTGKPCERSNLRGGLPKIILASTPCWEGKVTPSSKTRRRKSRY